MHNEDPFNENSNSLNSLTTKGVRQPLKKDDFSDLLSSQGFSKPAPGPRTLKDMRKESDIEGSIDPDRARVCLTSPLSVTSV